MADPNRYDVTRQVVAKNPSTGGNEPKGSTNPAPKADPTPGLPGFNSVGRC